METLFNVHVFLFLGATIDTYCLSVWNKSVLRQNSVRIADGIGVYKRHLQTVDGLFVLKTIRSQERIVLRTNSPFTIQTNVGSRFRFVALSTPIH